MASFRSEAEAFPGMSGMAEGHDRYARGLKPRVLDPGVVHLQSRLGRVRNGSAFFVIHTSIENP
jgi:hypothetical protein